MNKRNADIPSTQVLDLIIAYTAAKAGLEKIRDKEKIQSKETSKVEADLFDAIEDAGLRSVKVDGIGTISLNDLAWASITDRKVAMEWAEQTKPELLTLNHQQLSVLVRDAIKGEGEMPPGVDFSTSRRISWRKASK
jgi:hypothetical protein